MGQILKKNKEHLKERSTINGNNYDFFALSRFRMQNFGLFFNFGYKWTKQTRTQECPCCHPDIGWSFGPHTQIRTRQFLLLIDRVYAGSVKLCNFLCFSCYFHKFLRHFILILRTDSSSEESPPPPKVSGMKMGAAQFKALSIYMKFLNAAMTKELGQLFGMNFIIHILKKETQSFLFFCFYDFVLLLLLLLLLLEENVCV